MTKSSLRIAVNAEPFGFGPTAAIAGFFPGLRAAFETVAYMGEGHSLDLQRGLGYDRIHDLGHERAPDVLPHYDIFVTALDFGMAQKAKAAGLKTVIYDPLTWYWPSIPQIARDADLYIAQDFFGVRTRLERSFRGAAAKTVIVPPILQKTGRPAKDKKHVLFNLGGLQNPFFTRGDVIAYARFMLTGAQKALGRHENIVIAGSATVADELKQFGVQCYPREQMREILAHTKLAVMTPGLGNIYDAASYNIPTVWLPPANDSQGQQLRLLQEHGMIDASIEWHAIHSDFDVDYRGNQKDVLRGIADGIYRMAIMPEAMPRLEQEFAQNFTALDNAKKTRLGALTGLFGRNGEQEVTRAIRNFAATIKPTKKPYAHDAFFPS